MAAITSEVEVEVRRPRRSVVVGVVLVVWVAAYFVLRGIDTLALGGQETTAFHRWLTDHRDDVGQGNLVFDTIRTVVDQFVVLLQNVLSQASYGRPVPVIGWLGVVAVAAYLAWAFGNWKVALLTAGGLAFVGLQGLWQESMDTLALTIAAVLLSLLVGDPAGDLGRAVGPCLPGGDARPRPDADAADVRLPRSADLVLRDRTGRGDDRDR